MAAFVRFVFTIMIVGMGVNLAIVLLANAQSQRNQVRADQQNAERVSKLVREIDGRVRRADIIVESQRVDAGNVVLESTLLIRQYQAVGASQNKPLPVFRIVIPGDRLQATGLSLWFVPPQQRQVEGMPADYDLNFLPAYPFLKDAQVLLFGLFCGEGETAPLPTAINPVDERFTFLQRDRVPDLLRLDPMSPQASYYELKLWQNIWNQLPEIPRNAKLPWVSRKSTIKATWQSAVITLRRAPHTYSAFMSVEGITLNEDDPGIRDLSEAMLKEGKKLNLPVEE